MVQIYSIIGFIIGLIIISISLLKLRKQSITQGTFTLWTIVGVVLVISSALPILIFRIQRLVGTEFTLSAVFGISFLFLTIVVFYLHQKVDLLNQRITKLVAELAARKFNKPKDSDDA